MLRRRRQLCRGQLWWNDANCSLSLSAAMPQVLLWLDGSSACQRAVAQLPRGALQRKLYLPVKASSRTVTASTVAVQA